MLITGFCVTRAGLAKDLVLGLGVVVVVVVVVVLAALFRAPLLVVNDNGLLVEDGDCLLALTGGRLKLRSGF